MSQKEQTGAVQIMGAEICLDRKGGAPPQVRNASLGVGVGALRSLLSLLVAVGLFVSLLRRARVHSLTIGSVTAANVVFFLLAVPSSMPLGVFGVLASGTLSYAAFLPLAGPDLPP